MSFLGWGLYPAWLVAGGCDYLCHRLTDISHTSGPRESWLHLAQFVTLLAFIAVAVFVAPSLMAFALISCCVLFHAALSLIDVSYTIGRRHISAFEQFVHGFMDVLPFIAAALLILLEWPTAGSGIKLREPVPNGGLLILGSFVVVSGLAILEELVRAYRMAAAQNHGQQGTS